MVFAQQSRAQPLGVDDLLAQDHRLLAISTQMLAANASLCRRHMPLTGMAIHSRDQYGEQAASLFANGSITVALTLPGSPASAAGLAAGDGLAAIGRTRAADLRAEGEAPLRDAAFEVLADEPPAGPLILTALRDGREQTISVEPEPGCRALVEIRARDTLGARSDGRVIQVDHALAAAASDEELAVIFAHELGHLVLEHRRRLEAAGIRKGFFGEFGRNQQVNRQVEVEADRMSVHLLANAGYDPEVAPAFWRGPLARRAAGGLMRSSTYPSPESRARLIEGEIADYLGGGGWGPSWPGHLLARRDEPFAR